MPDPADPTRVLIVGPYALVRDGIRALLTGHDDLAVAGDCEDGDPAVALAGRCRPDVVLLDVDAGDGAEETGKQVRRLREASPSSDLVVLSPTAEPALIRTRINCGVRGFLIKSIQGQELLAAVRALRSDPRLLVLGVPEETVRRIDVPPGLLLEPVRSRPQPLTGRVAGLSARELEVLALVGQALSNGQIASRLALTEATVKRHLRNIFGKLGAVSRLDAVNKTAGLRPEPGWPGAADPDAPGLLWLGRWYRP
jgi:DNA-binding NarL/FixJ family response regulator